MKLKKAYVLYANNVYIPTVEMCVKSINTFSDIPVIVYLLNSDKQINGAKTINWECDVPEITKQEPYINRLSPDIYKLLIQRPLIVKDALEYYAETVAYIDSDTIVTKYVDNIFNYYPEDSLYPYFVEGIYDYFFINGRGGVRSNDSLEAPACELFNVNQSVRKKYRQTGYFVAGQDSIAFLYEWWKMCSHPEVIKDNAHYAPYNEETILQVLLYKHNFHEGLPYIYVNASLDELDNIYTKYEWGTEVRQWLRMPNSSQELLFIHMEKNPEIMEKMINHLKDYYLQGLTKKDEIMKILYLMPHCSTGGMPQFVLKRIECLQKYSQFEIFVVEYADYGPDYVVQKNKIKELVGNFFTLGENKLDLFRIMMDTNPDIIHIDEMSERLDSDLMNKLYSPRRMYKIVETCHDVSFVPSDKIFHPDCYAFCTPYHLETFAKLPSLKTIIEYPIDSNYDDNFFVKVEAQNTLKLDNDKTHILNVGLWASWKNQAEGLEIARKYPEMQFHFVGNQAGNFEDYWEPLMKDVPSNVTIWGERNDVDVFMKACDIFMFNSIWECNPLVLREAISYGLPIIARNLPQYGNMFAKYIQPIDTDLSTIQRNYEIPTDNTSEIFARNHESLYTKVVSREVIQQPVKITQYFVENPFLEITGNSNSDFLVKFFDDNNLCYYEQTIKSNHWIKLNRCWYTKWTTKIWENGTLIYENVLDYTDKRVFISFESESLGDTLAWMPYCEEFRKKHNCHLIVSTFKNFLFKKVYPNIEFVERGVEVQNLYGMYRIGWFYNKDKEPELCNTISLQKTASNILGIEYEEIIPEIDYIPKKRQFNYKYVTIATNSTSGCKHWQKADWQKVVDYLVRHGYKVINVAKEKNPLNNVEQIKDVSLENTMHVIHHSEFFIGLSSGLSWLAWTLKKPTVVIANFTNSSHEFHTNCIRITNTNVCHGCWNKPNVVFDKGDWNFCPVNKNTPKQFECHTSITGEMVINKLSPLLQATNMNFYNEGKFDWGYLENDKEVIINEMNNNIYEKVFQVEEGDIVLDIGASVGTFVCSILNKKPKHVYCIEPSEDEFPTLIKNTIGNCVTPIFKGISNANGYIINEQVFSKNKLMEGIKFSSLIKLYAIDKIDFLKTDCEGGEYDIFTEENIDFIQRNVKKVVGEFHLETPELKSKFRSFRDVFLRKFKNVYVYSLDGTDILWDLYNDHFIEYYREVIIHFTTSTTNNA